MYEADKEDENSSQEPQEQVIEPVEQEVIEFHGEDIIAVRLADGRIAVILRWICESLQLRPHGQVNRIRRTTAIAQELIRVRVETPRGGRQAMPALTLRGFPTWILGINPNEVEDKEGRQEETERIRNMITAYQVEAVDVLYRHFAQKAQARPALPAPTTEPQVIEAVSTSTVRAVREGASVVLAPIEEPSQEATHSERAAYHELMSVWHRHQADLHTQAWRVELEGELGSLHAQLEGEKAVTDLIPEILHRLGPETISPTHQGQVKGYVKQLHELTSKPYPTIYDDIRLAFGPASYKDLLEPEWSQIEAWFLTQIERAKRK